MKSGDRIDTIAAEEYGDPAKWRLIAEANDMEDPANIGAGQDDHAPGDSMRRAGL